WLKTMSKVASSKGIFSTLPHFRDSYGNCRIDSLAFTRLTDSSVKSNPDQEAPRRMICSESAPCPRPISRTRLPLKSILSKHWRMWPSVEYRKLSYRLKNDS